MFTLFYYYYHHANDLRAFPSAFILFMPFNSQSYQIHRLWFLLLIVWLHIFCPLIDCANPDNDCSRFLIGPIIIRRGKSTVHSHRNNYCYRHHRFMEHCFCCSACLYYLLLRYNICNSGKRFHMSYAFLRNFRGIVLSFRCFPQKVIVSGVIITIYHQHHCQCVGMLDTRTPHFMIYDTGCTLQTIFNEEIRAFLLILAWTHHIHAILYY